MKPTSLCRYCRQFLETGAQYGICKRCWTEPVGQAPTPIYTFNKEAFSVKGWAR